MIKVSPLKDTEREVFTKLFKEYYTELDCADDAKHLVDEYIIPDLLAGLINIELIEDSGKSVGFIIYQVDDINNEWNLKEGWGDIREIYISPSSRRQGLGKFVLYTAEMKLKESGAKNAYCLPYEEAIPFFTACGYKQSEYYSEELDCFVYEKSSLENCCKKG